MRALVTGTIIALLCAWTGDTSLAQSQDEQINHGRYLTEIAGCNDCHTAGYLLSEGKIPEAEWLLGDTFGWRGPWGTTYAPNLRLIAADMSEAEWITMAKSLKARPPMPWFNLNKMKDEDLKALYQYIRHLGPAGKVAPAYLPPDQQPDPPYALFPSPPE